VQSHSYSSWSNHSSSVHRRTCSLCSQIQEAAHSFGACQWRSANNRMEQQCSICNGWRTC
jgi:Tfp pilus assembly protein PilV